MELLSERVRLRDYEDADVLQVAAYSADPRFQQWNPLEGSATDHARRLVALFMTWAREQPRQNFQLAIVERATGHLIGSAGLRTAGLPGGCAEFGLELAAPRWGRGLAAEASRALLRFGFEAQALTEVRGASITGNDRVARLVRQLGFSEAGQRPGDPWAAARGWTHTDWVLTPQAFFLAAT